MRIIKLKPQQGWYRLHSKQDGNVPSLILYSLKKNSKGEVIFFFLQKSSANGHTHIQCMVHLELSPMALNREKLNKEGTNTLSPIPVLVCPFVNSFISFTLHS